VTEWILKPLGWLFAWRPAWRDAFGRRLLRLGPRVFWMLALFFALLGAVDLFGFPGERRLAQASFDWLMTHRPIPYRPDREIVVLDIDEASLAALAPEFGRWPWPSAVLGEVAAQIEGARAAPGAPPGARAVIFDILFSDPDVANPASEAAFDRYVMASRRSFFPVVRLNPANDSASGISLAMLNFAARDPAAVSADDRRTVAVIAPYFKSIYDSTRVGTNNIYPDRDNVVRWHSNYEILAGYRIPSLPFRVAQVLDWPLPATGRSLLNWPRGPTPYRSIRFADAWRAVRTHDSTFFAQLSGKIVLVGSTAPSLNDLRATPVDGLHPGIYVLGTAIDNTKNARFLRPLSAAWIWSLEVLMLIGSAHLFARTERALAVHNYFFIVPGVLLGISLLSVSVSDLLVDLSMPAALVLSFFTIAKLIDTNIRGFISGTGPYEATHGEIDGARLQIAWLPRSMSRTEVLDVLIRPGIPIKLWETADTGLGKAWAAQGWVLWRWASRGGETPDAPASPALNWFDADRVDGAGTAFALADALAAATSQSKPEVR
jgi:CHASE2 domain-containing sensor protein